MVALSTCSGLRSEKSETSKYFPVGGVKRLGRGPLRTMQGHMNLLMDTFFRMTISGLIVSFITNYQIDLLSDVSLKLCEQLKHKRNSFLKRLPTFLCKRVEVPSCNIT